MFDVDGEHVASLPDEAADDDEFFIGWQGKAPAATGRFLKSKTIALLASAALLATVVALMQSTVGGGRFEFGDVKDFTGVLVADPVPTLVGDDGVVYYLVNEFKFGLPEQVAKDHHLTWVNLRGTLVYNDLDAMIEVVPNSVTKAEGGPVDDHPLGVAEDLGRPAEQAPKTQKPWPKGHGSHAWSGPASIR